MNYPDNSTAIYRLKEWEELHDELKAIQYGIEKMFGCHPESQFYDTTWRVFDAYTIALAETLGDKGGDWMQWYCAENEMGASGHSAGYDGKTKPIKTMNNLYELILQGRKQKVQHECGSKAT